MSGLIARILAHPEIDMNNGSLWDNFELSDSYRNETRNYVQYCLGLTHDPYMTSIKPSNTTIQAFEEIGSNLRKAYNYGPWCY